MFQLCGVSLPNLKFEDVDRAENCCQPAREPQWFVASPRAGRMAQCLVFKYRGLLVVNLEDLKDDNVLPDEVVKMYFQSFEKSIKGLR